MRERRVSKEQEVDGIGITPACAGKTPNAVLVVVGTKDHPRVCGKDMDGTEVVREAVGSPPRVRERRFWLGDGCRAWGITPACEGKHRTGRAPLR